MDEKTKREVAVAANKERWRILENLAKVLDTHQFKGVVEARAVAEMAGYLEACLTDTQDEIRRLSEEPPSAEKSSA